MSGVAVSPAVAVLDAARPRRPAFFPSISTWCAHHRRSPTIGPAGREGANPPVSPVPSLRLSWLFRRAIAPAVRRWSRKALAWPCHAAPRPAWPSLALPRPAAPCRASPGHAAPWMLSHHQTAYLEAVLCCVKPLPCPALPCPAPPRHARPALLMGLPCAAQGAALLPAARDPCLASQPLAGSPPSKLSTPASKLMTTCFVSGGKFRNRRACGSGGCTGSRWGDIRQT